MRLTKLRTAYFRGFGDETEIPLDSDLVIIQGPNGSGKTTVSEAIEWLLSGSSQRQDVENIDAYEKRGALASVLRPADCKSYVEAEFATDDGPHTLRRELKINGSDEVQRLFIDGIEVEDLSPVGLQRARRFYPVVVQENLQHFIRSTGQQRRDHITRLLGLEALIDFEKELDSTVQRLDGVLPTAYQEAKAEISRLGRRLDEHSLLPDVAARWKDGEVERSDWESVRSLCAEKLGTDQEAVDILLSSARQKESAEKDAIIDLAEFSPPEIELDAADDSDTVIDAFDNLTMAVESQVSIQAEAYRRLDESLSSERLTFLGEGLELVEHPADHEAEDCPFCAEPTITVEKYEQIQQRHAAGKEFLNAKDKVDDVITEAKTTITRLKDKYIAARPTSPDDEFTQQLRELLGEEHTAVTAFLESIQGCRTTLNSLEDNSDGHLEFLDDVQDKLANPDEHQALNEFLAKTPDSLSELLGDSAEKLNEFAATFEELSDALEPVVSSQDQVRQLQLIQRLLNAREEIDRLATAEELRDFLKRFRSQTRAFVEGKTEDRISERGSEIRRWFDTLYGNEEDVLEFREVESRGTTMRMWVNVLGGKRHASTHLSQSQLNALGLSLHIVAGLSQKCPFSFVVFDDPIQSFDEKLRGRFVDTAVSSLIDSHEKQVIVSTHIEGFAKSLQYANSYRKPISHQVQPFSENGIQIDTGSWIGRALKDIRHRGRQPDKASRTVACQRMRPLGEQICKAIYQEKMRRSVPPDYERMTGPKIVDLLESVGGIANPDLARLRDIIQWAAGAGHDDPEWAPPDTSRIAQRADQLESIATTYGLSVNA